MSFSGWKHAVRLLVAVERDGKGIEGCLLSPSWIKDLKKQLLITLNINPSGLKCSLQNEYRGYFDQFSVIHNNSYYLSPRCSRFFF